MANRMKPLSLVFTALLAAAVCGDAVAGETARTVRRTVEGSFGRPAWLYAKPPHYEFSPLVSNSDPLTQHPHQWDGQDWDPSQWNGQWTPQTALQKFFDADIFERHYVETHWFTDSTIPVVELGPTFYKISDLDQRRTLKLLTDEAGYFSQGFGTVKLVDWATHDVVGVYTKKGMFLN